MNRTTTMAKLSEDLIMEILSFLPVKSLLQCKCVSKSWYSLISSTEFAKSHLRRAKEENNINRCSRVLLPSLPAAQSIDFEAASDARNFQAVTTLKYPDAIEVCSDDDEVEEDDPYVEILGSCNGLVCLCDEGKNMVVWNPSTRVSKTLPKHSIIQLDNEIPKHHSPQGRIDVMFSGLGYDEAIDDYKLVVGISQTVLGSCEITWSAEIFTFKSNAWQSIEVLENVTLMNPGIYLNQYIHWIGQKEEGTKKKFEIVSFDITEEKFKNIVPFPEIGNGYEYPMLMSLGLSRDRLCVFYESEENHFRAFVLDGFGDDATWVKVIDDPDSAFGLLQCIPLCLTNKGKLVYDVDSNLALCDPVSSACNFFKINSSSVVCDCNVYLETLVSPYT